jgi:hypothetical protein
MDGLSNALIRNASEHDRKMMWAAKHGELGEFRTIILADPVLAAMIARGGHVTQAYLKLLSTLDRITHRPMDYSQN